MTPFWKIAFVQVVVLLVGLVLIELALRVFFPLPVHGGIYLDRTGHPVRPSQDAVQLKPNLDLTHQGAEFSAKIRTNALGYRRMGDGGEGARRPDFVFIGDSFTFGHGVADEQVFSAIFCTNHHFVCQNLGRPGTATYDQVKVLDYALNAYDLRPKTVVLVMLAACWLDSSGNDLGDNLRYREAQTEPATGAAVAPVLLLAAADATVAGATAPTVRTPPAGLVKTAQAWFGSLEIGKRLMLGLSSAIKRGSYSCSEPSRMAQALQATKPALDDLDRLAQRYGFSVVLFVIHPYQELDGAFRQTERDVATIVPRDFSYFPTGQYFRPEHYYRYDGHFNVAGHAQMATVIERSLEGR